VNRTAKAWLIAWPILLPAYALMIITYPVVYVVRTVWRTVMHWD
jgi:hypothetical protein